MKAQIKELKKHQDKRGILYELYKDKNKGQFYFSTSKPGMIRGGHYHTRKWEIFFVIKGKGKIVFEDIKTKKRKEAFLDEKTIKGVKILPGTAHAVKNIGKEEMILLVYCNEAYNKKDTDTYRYEIEF